MKTYKANNIKEITISGKGDHPIWEKGNSLTDFSSPWDDKPIDKIEFKAVYNSEKIFFLFKVFNPKIYIHPSEDKHISFNNSDRVELYFRADAFLNPYYCLEIDSTSRVMDYKAKPNREFDFNWSWPLKSIEVKSSIEAAHFTVEVAIEIATLNKLGLLKEGEIEFGIYQAKYNLQQNGTYKPTWITWVNPNTETPDFHTSTSFGRLNLEGYK